jgi:plastocyanin/sugar lactone lactonase YvrE
MPSLNYSRISSVVTFVSLVVLSSTFSFDSVYAESPPQSLFKFGSSGSGDGQFGPGGPYGIALDSSGNIYVADNDNNRIQKFDSSGNFILKFGSSGSGDGQFTNPKGVVVDKNNNLYVTDSGNDRIQKFDSSGNFILKFSTFYYPMEITVDNSNNILVVDYFGNSVQKFDSSGNFILKFGSSGSGNGQLNNPSDVKTDASNNIFVVDAHNYRIQKFDSSGNFILKFGSSGSGDGQFLGNIGLALDSNGNIFVADNGRQNVQKFDSSGNFILKFGSSGSGDGQFHAPYGLAIDSLNRIFVSENFNHRIQVFTVPPTVITPPNMQITTTNAGGIAVTYPTPTATNSVGGTISPTCTPPSGSTFPIGNTTVTCTAKDAAGSVGQATFTVTVKQSDTTPPIITPPVNQIVIATNSNGMVVNYPAPTATDNVGVTNGPTCNPPSGSTFPIGTTTVTCTASDAAANIGKATFTVTVQSPQQFSPTITTDKQSYSVGNTVVISGTNFPANANLILAILNPNPNVNSTALSITSTNQGQFSTIWTIPSTFGTGTYTIQLYPQPSVSTKIQVSANINSFPVTVTPTSGNTPLTVSFNLNLGSTTSRNVEWNFGDGSPHDTTNRLTITHVYQKSGNFTGTVNVISSDYTSQTQVFYVNVVPSSSNSNQTNTNQNSTTTTTPTITVSTDRSSYNYGDKIYFSGISTNDSPYVTIVIYGPNNNFVLLASGITDNNQRFQIIVDTSTQSNQPKFSLTGTYSATAFTTDKTKGATTSFDFSPANTPLVPPIPTPQSGISAITDKPSYSAGDSIVVSGTVNSVNSVNPQKSVTIQTYNANNDLVRIDQAVPSPSGQYSVTIPAHGPLWQNTGTYTLKIKYDLPNTFSQLTFYFNSGNVSTLPTYPSSTQTNNVIITKGSSSGQACVAANNCFDPANAQVAVGETVTWTNADTASHTVTSGKPSDNTTGTIFDSGLIKSGGTFSFKFTDAGTFYYYCQVHPWMIGQIIVGKGSIPYPTNPSASTSVFTPTQQDIQNINEAKASQTIAAEVNVGANHAETKSIDNNVSVQTTINNPDSLESKVTASAQTGPKVIMFNLPATTVNVQNLKDLGIMYDGKPISPALNMDAILHAKSTDNPSFVIVVTQSGVQVLVLVPHFSTHTITITNMSKVIPSVPEFPFAILTLIIATFSIVLIPKMKQLF